MAQDHSAILSRGGDRLPRPLGRAGLLAVCTTAGFLGTAPATRADTVEQVVVSAAHPPEAAGSPAFSIVTLDAGALSTTGRLDTALEQVPGISLFRRTASISANPTTQGISLRSIAPSGVVSVDAPRTAGAGISYAPEF